MPEHYTQKHVRLPKSLNNDRGQGLVEYALIFLLIVIVVLVAFKGIGSETYNKYSVVSSAVMSASQ